MVAGCIWFLDRHPRGHHAIQRTNRLYIWMCLIVLFFFFFFVLLLLYFFLFVVIIICDCWSKVVKYFSNWFLIFFKSSYSFLWFVFVAVSALCAFTIHFWYFGNGILFIFIVGFVHDMTLLWSPCRFYSACNGQWYTRMREFVLILWKH